MNTDIPLEEVMILWRPSHYDGGMPEIKAVRHPVQDDQSLPYSDGACTSGWREMKPVEQMTALFQIALGAIIRDGVPANKVREAFQAIREFRQSAWNEAQYAAMSGAAFATARGETLESGQSVLQSENGVIYEVFPDGSRIERKRIEPPTSIPAGTRISIW